MIPNQTLNLTNRYNMTQHIKTHFKDCGIKSLAANGFAQFAKLAGAAGGVGTPEGYRNESGEISRSNHGQEMEDRDKMIDDIMGAGNEGEEEGDGYDDDGDDDEEVIEPC